MSLLMDALRKAEEAKKKAEKAEPGPGRQQQAQEAQSATVDTDTPLQIESTPPRDVEPAVMPEKESESPTPIPNVKIEFQRSEEDAGEQPVSPPAGETDAETAAAPELSLEPIDSSLSSIARQPFDQTVTPDYSLETAATARGSTSSPDYTSQSSPDASAAAAAPDEDAALEPEQATEATADDSRRRADETQENPAAEDAGHSASKPAAEPQLEPAAPVEEEIRGRASAQDRSRSRSKTEPNPNLQPDPVGSPVVARSAADQRSARAVFAAKKQGKGRRFRIRRSTRIWAAQIAAVVILLAGGAYFYLSTRGNANSFNVPEEYLVNQDAYSNEFNEELAAIEDAAAEAEPDLDELAAVAAGLLPASSDLDALPLPGAPGSVVEPVTQAATTAPAVDVAAVDDNPVDSNPIASIPGAVDDGVAQAQQLATQTATDAAAPDASTDTAPAVQQPQTATEARLTSNSFQSSQQASAPISFSRAQPVNVIDPLLQDAYVAYQRDELARAQELYQQVLSESPLQRDALLGLAAIATRNGEASLAMELYSRLLARDPSDGVARAGLLGLRPLGGPETQERELRRLLEDHPEVAPVVYALGNFYAGQNRWNEAQRYYFNALQLAKTDALAGIPVNPDYAFNLAVSLERLRQPAAAENYYREAIAFAADFPAGFDITIARNRLSRLTGRGF